jgi:hypothetical protein
MFTTTPFRIAPLRPMALFVTALCSGGVVIDRIAVIVGKHAIKASDIDRDLRLTEFLNNEPLNFNSEAKHKSADRLIDQEIIRQEILMGGYRRPAGNEGEAIEMQLIRDRFHDSGTEFSKALAAYGLTETQLRAQLLWQLTVLRFIDQRFPPQAQVSDDKQAAAEQVNRDFTAWLDQARKRDRIEYAPEAFK